MSFRPDEWTRLKEVFDGARALPAAARSEYLARACGDIFTSAFDPSTGTVAGPPTPITRGSRLYTLPDLSPDNQWVSFGLAGASEDIFLARTDGSEPPRQLTAHLYQDRERPFNTSFFRARPVAVLRRSHGLLTAGVSRSTRVFLRRRQASLSTTSIRGRLGG